jgi:hypothetical protein
MDPHVVEWCMSSAPVTYVAWCLNSDEVSVARRLQILREVRVRLRDERGELVAQLRRAAFADERAVRIGVVRLLVSEQVLPRDAASLVPSARKLDRRLPRHLSRRGPGLTELRAIPHCSISNPEGDRGRHVFILCEAQAECVGACQAITLSAELEVRPTGWRTLHADIEHWDGGGACGCCL